MKTIKKSTNHSLFDKGVLVLVVVACATAVGIAAKPRPMEKLGLEHLHNGFYHAATATLKQAVETHGPSLESYLGLAKASNHMSNYKEGLAYADLALKHYPSEPSAWAERAVSNLGLRDYRAALSDAEEALAYDSHNNRAILARSRAQTMIAQSGGSKTEASSCLTH